MYCGEQQDDTTGLYYLRARYMNPETGTFTSMDTYGGSVFDPTSIHKYLYANANPVSYTDPSGYMTLMEGVATIAISTVLGGVISGGYELLRQLATGRNLNNLDWKKIKSSAKIGALFGLGIGIAIVCAEVFLLAIIYEALGCLGIIFGCKFTIQSIVDLVKYKNPKLTLLDLTMAIFSFWGAKKAFDRAPIIEDKAAKAAETAKSTTDSSTENTNNVKNNSGDNNPSNSGNSQKSNSPKGGRGKNNLKPDPNAEGPHTTYRTDPNTGEITHYIKWEPNPKNPTGFDEVLRYDGVGGRHYNKVTGEYVETPHVHDPNAPGGVRPAEPWEIP